MADAGVKSGRTNAGLGKWIILLGVALALMAWLAVGGTRSPAGHEDAGRTMSAKSVLKTEGMETTASGLKYEVISEGTGEQPIASDLVLVHYEGRLEDGSVFDSSYERGQPAPFPLAGVVPGFSEGLQLMKTGAKYRFIFPPHLGYGAAGAGGVIPPNATLQFIVELLDIAPRDGDGDGEGEDKSAPAAPAE